MNRKLRSCNNASDYPMRDYGREVMYLCIFRGEHGFDFIYYVDKFYF